MAKLHPTYVRLDHSQGTVEGWLTWSEYAHEHRQVNDLPRVTYVDLRCTYTIDEKEHRVYGPHTLTRLEDPS